MLSVSRFWPVRAVTAHGHRLPSANLASATTLLPCPWRHPATLMLGPPAALMPAAAVASASLLAAVPRLAGLLPCRLPAFRFRACVVIIALLPRACVAAAAPAVAASG